MFFNIAPCYFAMWSYVQASVWSAVGLAAFSRVQFITAEAVLAYVARAKMATNFMMVRVKI